MIVGPLDLGPNNPFKKTRTGLHTSVVEIPGGYAIPYAVDSTHPAWSASIWVQAQSSVGQYSAKTLAATESLCRQLEELVRNFDQQPVYVQVFAGTGVVALSPTFQQPQDGWYYISGLDVDYSRSLQSFCPITLNLEYVSPGPPRRVAIWNSGGALSSTFAGAATNWVSYPFNSSQLAGSVTRTGGEGAVKITTPVPQNPQPYVLSATISDWSKGGCHVYDVMAAIGTNAVPAPPTFLNTNWIEVFGADHRFVGDVVITNGLLLLVFSVGVLGPTCYLWNTALATPGWQQFVTAPFEDDSFNGSLIEQISLRHVGPDDVSWEAVQYTPAGGISALFSYRLQRGAYHCRVDIKPTTQTETSGFQMVINGPAPWKFGYSSSGIADVLQNNVGVPADATYGYGAAFINSTTYPFITGFLYKDVPANQPKMTGSTSQIALGDSGGPAVNTFRSYGIFAAPFGNSTDTTNRLQAEGESGTLGTGWSSIADGAASGGNTAKCASGTLSGNADTFGTAWVPPGGTYDCWFYVRVTSLAGSTNEMTLGLWDATSSAFVASTTYKANQGSTVYAWLRVAANVTPTATHNMQFRAVTAATLGTDWFIDQAALVPLFGGWKSPGDIWQQFIYYRDQKQVLL